MIPLFFPACFGSQVSKKPNVSRHKDWFTTGTCLYRYLLRRSQERTSIASVNQGYRLGKNIARLTIIPPDIIVFDSFLLEIFGIQFFPTLGTDAVTELGFRTFPDIILYRLPMTLVVSNLLAVRTYGKKTGQYFYLG